MLETAFLRPYTLFLEYPSDYVHNKPFKSMLGDGDGEKLLFAKKIQPKTNETQYTKRVLKVIQSQWFGLKLKLVSNTIFVVSVFSFCVVNINIHQLFA